ncbi:hypothetical protein ACFRKB_38550 [Streptomyces scopuliridis]|uniref:hypothetical protein n=1 Tax=Streptomyces scopuliridis TaxID=452529 RepID=UPI00368B9252
MDSLSVVSAIVAVCGAAVAALFSYWQQRRLRSWEQRNYMDWYGASLAWASFDLQARLYNILPRHVVDTGPSRGFGFLTSFLRRGTDREADFVRSTVFVLAEYLGWVEILRRDIQFFDLGRSRVNTQIMLHISRIGASLARIDTVSNELRPFRVQQRAVGACLWMSGGLGEPGHGFLLGSPGASGRLGRGRGRGSPCACPRRVRYGPGE